MFQRLVSAASGLTILALNGAAMAQATGAPGAPPGPALGPILTIPEPGTLTLLVGGLVCVGLIWLRRKSS